MKRLEKKVLKKILENHVKLDTPKMTPKKLMEITNKTQEEIIEIINLLLIKDYIQKRDGELSHWTVRSLMMTTKGLKALNFPWEKIIQNFLIGIATIISIIALLQSQ